MCETHLAELHTWRRFFISWQGSPLMRAEDCDGCVFSGPLCAFCASSKSSLKRSLWARSLQSPLPPGLLQSPWPVDWADASPSPSATGARGCERGKIAADSGSSCTAIFTAIEQALLAAGFTGSTASNTCSISSSRANVDSPSTHSAPPPWDGDGVCDLLRCISEIAKENVF